ncbi:hypothetical protein KP509_18G001400 [Ceratopteris richardii]|uniref:Uncharacterized protein n=1 Tax=Ceratopteris richardii TaxID=49495 RepID=A0A8T2SNN5_CERRI|nr:hypothetical protein KP509_18G001400 [Ceratopteris richardii]
MQYTHKRSHALVLLLCLSVFHLVFSEITSNNNSHKPFFYFKFLEISSPFMHSRIFYFCLV